MNQCRLLKVACESLLNKVNNVQACDAHPTVHQGGRSGRTTAASLMFG